MLTTCESCRDRSAVWRVEFDQDLDVTERVRFDVCDGCLLKTDSTDPNMRVEWIGGVAEASA